MAERIGADNIDYEGIEREVADNKIWKELEQANIEREAIEKEYREKLNYMQEPVLIEPEEQEESIAKLKSILDRVRQVRERQRGVVARLNEAAAERSK